VWCGCVCKRVCVCALQPPVDQPTHGEGKAHQAQAPAPPALPMHPRHHLMTAQGEQQRSSAVGRAPAPSPSSFTRTSWAFSQNAASALAAAVAWVGPRDRSASPHSRRTRIVASPPRPCVVGAAGAARGTAEDGPLVVPARVFVCRPRGRGCGHAPAAQGYRPRPRRGRASPQVPNQEVCVRARTPHAHNTAHNSGAPRRASHHLLLVLCACVRAPPNPACAQTLRHNITARRPPAA